MVTARFLKASAGRGKPMLGSEQFGEERQQIVAA
jgi:hypothetical protein